MVIQNIDELVNTIGRGAKQINKIQIKDIGISGCFLTCNKTVPTGQSVLINDNIVRTSRGIYKTIEYTPSAGGVVRIPENGLWMVTANFTANSKQYSVSSGFSHKLELLGGTVLVAGIKAIVPGTYSERTVLSGLYSLLKGDEIFPYVEHNSGSNSFYTLQLSLYKLSDI